MEDPISFTDLAPTILNLTVTNSKGMLPIIGRSIVNILKSKKEGIVDQSKKYVFAGRERHSSSRWNNLGYPQRIIRDKQYLYIWNIKPERWPAGDPRAVIPASGGELLPMYGIDEKGKHHSDWAFTDVDESPSKTYLVENFRDEKIFPFFELAFALRPEYELYDVINDPLCLKNLAGNSSFLKIERTLRSELIKELTDTKDPRVVGPDPEIFDSYERYSPIREFPNPGYINESRNVLNIQESVIKKSDIMFKPGPSIDLKWDFGPVSLGLVMDMSIVSLSERNSQDLLISRIWQGLYIYPSGTFSEMSILKQPYFLGKAGILLFQPSDWNNDGVTDLIAADRGGFLYSVQGKGIYPDINYDISETTIMRDASNNLPFNIPYDNPNFPQLDNLGGYIDLQYYNYIYPKIYSSTDGKFRDLIIGDRAGNLWWLPDQSDGKGQPSYRGVKYTKEKSNQRAAIQYQKNLGLEYVKPEEKICDEKGLPFMLGVGKEVKAIFKGSNTRPIVYPDESGIPGLLVLAGSNNQQVFYLKRINSLSERKPVFRNMGEVRISGLEKTKINFHSKLCLFNNNRRQDLLLASSNHLTILENTGWEKGIPKFLFHNWICGTEVTGSFYAFNDILIDNQGRRFIIHFVQRHWNMIPIEKSKDGIMLHYTDSLQIMDQNGIFRVEGETDPQSAPEFGYHRISHWNFDGTGRNHLIAATDKGLLYLLKDDPSLAKPGKFIFRSSGPLKDTSGKVIKIHNRAVAGGIDLNNDGREDLLVGGISYQLGIKSDPNPGGGIYYILNLGNDKTGSPILSPPLQMDLGPAFKPRINSHIGLQVIDIDNDGEKEVIISLQDQGWDGRIYSKLKNKIGLSYTGQRVPVIPINEQVLDIDGDSQYELIRPGGEAGVGNYKKLEKY